MNKFEKILLTIFFIELFVGGGGRLIDFHIISIRQILFITLFITFIIRIIRTKEIYNKEVNTFIQFKNPVAIGVYLLIGWFVISSLIGIINGHSKGAVVTDFLRVIFVIVYFPLAHYISKDRFSLEKIIKILKYSAIAVALFTIVVSLLGKTVFSYNFVDFYHFMNKVTHNDLFFRPSRSVFYKSDFFVLIGIIISLNDILNKKFQKVDVFVIICGATSLIWSETRGFLLAFMLGAVMIIALDAKVITDPIKGFAQKLSALVKSKQFLKKLIITIVILIAVPILYNNMTLERFKNATDTTQLTQNGTTDDGAVNDVSVTARMKFIVASEKILIHPVNLVFGTGYGTVIAGRINGIEMSFLDILVEQGIIGLASWFFLFLIVYLNYNDAYKKGHKLSTLEISLLSAFMAILLLTNINPFINNPIGLIFLIVLLVASQNRKKLSPKGNSK